MAMRVGMSYLRNKRQKHAKHDDSDVTLGETVCAWVGIHITVCGGVIMRMRGRGFGHGVHGDVAGRVSDCQA